MLEAVYTNAPTDEVGLSSIVQHYAALPEFHITNNLVDSKSTVSERPVPNITLTAHESETPQSVEGYKAIVYIYLRGGMDSYSVLVPSEDCYLHEQYLYARGDVAITSGLLPIDTSNMSQPCDSFGVHPSLANVRHLYNDGDASFIA
jgi:hypothetical protein